MSTKAKKDIIIELPLTAMIYYMKSPFSVNPKPESKANPGFRLGPGPKPGFSIFGFFRLSNQRAPVIIMKKWDRVKSNHSQSHLREQGGECVIISIEIICT